MCYVCKNNEFVNSNPKDTAGQIKLEAKKESKAFSMIEKYGIEKRKAKAEMEADNIKRAKKEVIKRAKKVRYEERIEKYMIEIKALNLSEKEYFTMGLKFKENHADDEPFEAVQRVIGYYIYSINEKRAMNKDIRRSNRRASAAYGGVNSVTSEPTRTRVIILKEGRVETESDD